ncbi:hypothetical protein [uncultured Winogradskyella sp.]|uniref:hypothetical protein n=1 Tax=uncultured Winogradskyella sp. TaxID=395353 RepID=UPI002636BA2D|nr:hypothetical protein [uncultured Winogradskyella sp.]
MNKLKIISLIKICAFTVFLGRAYQLYFFGAPFRAILWDESLLTPIVEGIFNYPWYEYATSPKVNAWIEGFTKACSLIFFAAAFICLFWDRIKLKKVKSFIVGLALLLLLFIGICMVKDKNYEYLLFFELFIQFAAPIMLLFNVKLDITKDKKIVNGLKLAIACTFIAHGLFAMGLIYLPGHFVDMTIIILGVTEPQATTLLYVVGVLDIITSVLLFVPKLSKYALMYMIFWGFTTAFARLVAGFSSNFIFMSLHNSVFLVIYRLSHGILPFIVLVMEEKFKMKIIKIPTNEN